MIEGAILLAELGLFLILLLKVWRVQSRNEEEGTGFFAYRVDKRLPKAAGAEAGRTGEPPHA